MKRPLLSLAIVALAVATTSSCASEQAPRANSDSADCKIAFLLPENTTPRYEASDRPLFLAAVKARDSRCKVLYFNAGNAADRQQQQAESALSQGVQVLVLDPVNVDSSSSIVEEARSKGVKTVTYDRAAGGPLAYRTGFDNIKVGELQANALIAAMQEAGHRSGKIVMINGAPDNTGALFKQGAHNVLDKSGYSVAAEYDTEGWLPNNATTEMTQAITKVGKQDIVGVYVANDTLAGASITAMQQAGMRPLPPTTGLDATTEGLQRILIGTQYMTIYKNLKAEAAAAAEAAVALAHGKKPAKQPLMKNPTGDMVPTRLIPPIAVTAGNLKSTVVKDGFVKPGVLCRGDAARACTEAGIHP